MKRGRRSRTRRVELYDFDGSRARQRWNGRLARSVAATNATAFERGDTVWTKPAFDPPRKSAAEIDSDGYPVEGGTPPRRLSAFTATFRVRR